MLAHRNFTRFVAVLTAVAVCLCLLAVAAADQLISAFGGNGATMEYESALFDTDAVIEINIRIDADDFQEMLDHAIDEEYVSCDVEIGGKTFYNVGIRPKGNTSLSSIVNNPDSDRYSFKLEFDKYVEGQTCFGLDKLVLNNNYADATNMKEAIIYDMYRFLDTDASLYNYVKLSINGAYFGVYLALEAVEESFMLRNFGTEKGALYKPEGMQMGGGDRGNFLDDAYGAHDDHAQKTEDVSNSARQADDGTGMSAPSDLPSSVPDSEENGVRNMPNFAKNGVPSFSGFGKSGGADLNYIDDDLDSYETIWEGEVTDTGKQDHKRVIAALKAIAAGEDLESYLDVDNVLRYMAVHTFAVNADSLSGNMAHNYYLYESGGQLNILPWDYNLSFGGMNGGDASSVVNDAVDTPFAATQFFDALLENDDYLAQYHIYLSQLVEDYVFGGGFDVTYARIRTQIDALVETDPNALYTFAEYTAAAEMLYDTVRLRGESVRGQLAGSIPSTDAGQRTDPSALVDASSVDLSVMGTMMGGGRGGDRGNREHFEMVDSEERDGEMPPFRANDQSDGEMIPKADAGDAVRAEPQMPPTQPADTADHGESAGDGQTRINMADRTEKASWGMQQDKQTHSVVLQNLLWYGGMFLLALLGLGMAILYKRR